MGKAIVMQEDTTPTFTKILHHRIKEIINNFLQGPFPETGQPRPNHVSKMSLPSLLVPVTLFFFFSLIFQLSAPLVLFVKIPCGTIHRWIPIPTRTCFFDTLNHRRNIWNGEFHCRIYSRYLSNWGCFLIRYNGSKQATSHLKHCVIM